MFENFTNTDMDILEEPISDLEARRIKRLIAKKVSQKQRGRKKGLVVALLACCIMLTGVTAFAFTELNIADAFRAIFGEKASYLDNLYPIEESVSEAGLTVTVRGVAGYDKNAFILVDIVRDDGIHFVGNNLDFKIRNLDVDGVSNLSTGSTGVNVVDGKAVITFNIQSTDDLKGNNVSLRMGNLEYRELKLEKASLDMLDSLELPQIGAESLIENTREVVVYKDSYAPRDTDSPYFSKYIRNPALIPGKIAESQNLNLPLLEDKPGLLLDTAGFVDGRLHVRVLDTSKEDYHGEVFLYMMDPQTGDIAPMMLWTEPAEIGDAVYYVYDISDVSRLEQYELMIEYYGEKESFMGMWNMEFVLDYQTEDPGFQPVVDMRGYDSSFILDEIHVTPIATTIRFLPRDGYEIEEGFFLAAEIRMKDGSYINHTSSGASTVNQEYLDYRCFYNPIDINEIDAVIIKSWEELNDERMNTWFDDAIEFID